LAKRALEGDAITADKLLYLFANEESLKDISYQDATADTRTVPQY